MKDRAKFDAANAAIAELSSASAAYKAAVSPIFGDVADFDFKASRAALKAAHARRMAALAVVVSTAKDLAR